jgi:hypothetical protein
LGEHRTLGQHALIAHHPFQPVHPERLPADAGGFRFGDHLLAAAHLADDVGEHGFAVLGQVGDFDPVKRPRARGQVDAIVAHVDVAGVVEHGLRFGEQRPLLLVGAAVDADQFFVVGLGAVQEQGHGRALSFGTGHHKLGAVIGMLAEGQRGAGGASLLHPGLGFGAGPDEVRDLALVRFEQAQVGARDR